MNAFICSLGAAACLAAPALAGRTIYVAPCGNNAWSGQTTQCVQPGGPMLTLRAAVDAAVAGDTIMLMDGVYSGPDNRGLAPRNMVVIRSLNGPLACRVDLQGQDRFMTIGSGASGTVLEGLIISNGTATVDQGGGGVLVQDAAAGFVNCTFDSCTASQTTFDAGGGAVFVAGGARASFDACMFTNNSAYPTDDGNGRGGAIKILEASAVQTTITHCVFRNNIASWGGGLLSDGNPVVSGCTFENNTAGFYGGGGALQSSSPSDLPAPVYQDCAFRRNLAGSGGGMTIEGSYTLVSGCVFDSNSAVYTQWGAGFGGAVRIGFYGVNPTLTDCTFTGNLAQEGGGVYAGPEVGTLTVSACRFVGNRANFGAGAVVGAGSVMMTGTAFERNVATPGWGYFGGPGALFLWDGNGTSTATIRACEFRWNTASVAGAAELWGYFLDAAFVDCAFAGNRAVDSGEGAYAGAMSVEGAARVRVVTSTFTANSADAGAGACQAYDGGVLMLSNCVLWGDSAPVGPELIVHNQVYGGEAPATARVSYTDVQGARTSGVHVAEGATLTWGAGNFGADPLFVATPGPGADGAWGTADDVPGDLRLSATSRCIDAGSNGAMPEGAGTDLAGLARYVDDAGTPDAGAGPGAVVDLGAYEFQGTSPTHCGTADFNGDGDVGTDADIESFFACLAGSCCETCGLADFNNDGDIGTDADIEAFFRTLAGGFC